MYCKAYIGKNIVIAVLGFIASSRCLAAVALALFLPQLSLRLMFLSRPLLLPKTLKP